MTSTAANNNRVKTADRLARMETALTLLTKQVGTELVDAKEERREHSRRLDGFELALARMEQGQKERDQLRKDVDAVESDVKKLRSEQRIWASANTMLGPLAAAVMAWLKGN